LHPGNLAVVKFVVPIPITGNNPWALKQNWHSKGCPVPIIYAHSGE